MDSWVVRIKKKKQIFVFTLGFHAYQSFKAALFWTSQSSTKNVNEVKKELFVEIL